MKLSSIFLVFAIAGSACGVHPRRPHGHSDNPKDFNHNFAHVRLNSHQASGQFQNPLHLADPGGHPLHPAPPPFPGGPQPVSAQAPYPRGRQPVTTPREARLRYQPKPVSPPSAQHLQHAPSPQHEDRRPDSPEVNPVPRRPGPLSHRTQHAQPGGPPAQHSQHEHGDRQSDSAESNMLKTLHESVPQRSRPKPWRAPAGHHPMPLPSAQQLQQALPSEYGDQPDSNSKVSNWLNGLPKHSSEGTYQTAHQYHHNVGHYPGRQ